MKGIGVRSQKEGTDGGRNEGRDGEPEGGSSG